MIVLLGYVYTYIIPIHTLCVYNIALEYELKLTPSGKRFSVLEGLAHNQRFSQATSIETTLQCGQCTMALSNKLWAKIDHGTHHDILGTNDIKLCVALFAQI